MEEGGEVFLDKIKLGAVIVQKELNCITLYNRLISDLRDYPDLISEINHYPAFNECLKSFAELYDFLKNDYLDKLDKKKASLISEKFNKYEFRHELTFEDLKIIKDIILEIMSISKFHDIVRKSETRGINSIKKRYNLK